MSRIGNRVLTVPENVTVTCENGCITVKGPKGELSFQFKKMLEERLNIPVHLEDERLTTKQAENILIHNDTSRKKRKKVIDSMAATIILQSYLDKNK